MKNLVIKGARQHNLQNITLELPRDKLIVVTGVSGSGKSTLAFDTIYAEGQRRYVESLSSYARQFLGIMNKPDVDSIEGLSPAISIEQKTTSKNPRSTVGTVTEIYDYLRLLYARIGVPYCPKHQVKIQSRTPEQIADAIQAEFPAGGMITIFAPIIRKKKGTYEQLFRDLNADGFTRVRVDGEIRRTDDEIKLARYVMHNIDIVVDRFDPADRSRKRSKPHSNVPRTDSSMPQDPPDPTPCTPPGWHARSAVSPSKSFSPVCSPSTARSAHARPVTALAFR